ncbi:MAG: ORF6N domain-containing protein [Candidatus Solibacter usitatus]|nr:ORF6N domain-containing protein [Candidatus Solibacter usitatus]
MDAVAVARAPDLVPLDAVERFIFVLRDTRIMLDSDLAALYGVPTGTLNQAVKRNRDRFPEDFMFRLTREETRAVAVLRSQIVMSKVEDDSEEARGGRRFLPYAFTEQGVAMLSSVLRSQRAIFMNIAIMRAFVRLRRILATHRELEVRLTDLERDVGRHTEDIQVISQVLNHMLAPPEDATRRPMGFPAGA